jgi:hypothetical protein
MKNVYIYPVSTMHRYHEAFFIRKTHPPPGSTNSENGSIELSIREVHLNIRHLKGNTLANFGKYNISFHEDASYRGSINMGSIYYAYEKFGIKLGGCT